jgi:formyltetrahydrofolate deformylase
VTRARIGEQGLLTLSCPDVPGIVHAVAGFLVDQGCTILESQQFGDPDSRTFFTRVRFGRSDGGALDAAELRRDFTEVADRFDMTVRLVDPAQPLRVVIMVSKLAHCLNDLLYRCSVGDLNLEVVAVVSNHEDLRALAAHYGVPFAHIPVTPDSKDVAERELTELVEQNRVELVVLARYMQILSEGLCADLEGRAINIHHSMLPSFKGARPYHQAHDRGVKLIGATAHYVTSNLDEGPIIEQDVIPVDHSMSVEDLVGFGREVECRVLARAVRWHSENRIVLNGARTVILR